MFKNLHLPIFSLSSLSFLLLASVPASAQPAPSYTCYFIDGSGQVLNLTDICGGGGQQTAAAGESLVFQNLQVSSTGITGQILNQSNQPVQLDGLTYQINSGDGASVLQGQLAISGALQPGVPTFFATDFNADQQTLLGQFASSNLQLSVVPNVTGVAQTAPADPGTTPSFVTTGTAAPATTDAAGTATPGAADAAGTTAPGTATPGTTATPDTTTPAAAQDSSIFQQDSGIFQQDGQTAPPGATTTP